MSVQDAHYLVLNTGSSSIKYAVFDAQSLAVIERDHIDLHHTQFEEGIEQALAHAGRVVAVGHRVVHGGSGFCAPLQLNSNNIADLKALSPLAPLHQQHNLHGAEVLMESHPELVQVACFDTAFHRTQSDLEQCYALPLSLREQGVQRYGFHGLSYEYIASVLPHYASNPLGRTLVLHLGSGASACALHHGVSVASSMGFTALDGLMMSTRCGQLDAGVVLYMQQHLGMSASDIEQALYKQSGLLGVSGFSSDMRQLLASDLPAAREAVDLFCHYALRACGSLITALQGLDTLVFTAGIGQHQPLIRQRIAQGLAWLGCKLDEESNQQQAPVISTPDGAVQILMIPTDEERMIARHMRAILGPAA